MASKKKSADQIGLFVLPSSKSPDSVPVIPNRQPEESDDAGRSKGPIRDPSLPHRAESRAGTHDSPEPLSAGSPLASHHDAADLDLESFDDYDDAATVGEVPRLRLLDPPRDAPTVIVEAVGDVFEVSRLRDNGTTVACVMWTRKELEELQRRIVAALET